MGITQCSVNPVLTRPFRFVFIFLGDRVIDVGSEWRTFSNDKATKDPSRVGDSQNPLLSDGDLSTMIGKVIDPLGRKHKVWTDQRPRSLATWQKYPSLPHEDF